MSEPFNTLIIQRQLSDIFSRTNHYRLKDTDLVRIPEIPGRIFTYEKNGATHIELIYRRWYDPETKQTRNRKTEIGRVFELYPTAMIPTEKYAEFFDPETGKLLRPLEDPEAQKEKTGKPAGERKKRKVNPTPPERPDFPRMKAEPEDWPVTGPDPEPEPEPEQESKDPDSDKDDKVIQEILENLRRNRERWEREEREKKEREEEEKRLTELYGEEEAGEVMAEQAARSLRKMLEDSPEGKDMNEQQTEEKKTQEEPGNPEAGEELEKAYEEYTRSRERAAILRKILQANLASIRNHAKRRPDDRINAFKVQKINAVLAEIRGKYQDSGYADLLELIDEPGEEERDGVCRETGMTYSDAEMLLDRYDTILTFIKADKNKNPKT